MDAGDSVTQEQLPRPQFILVVYKIINGKISVMNFIKMLDAFGIAVILASLVYMLITLVVLTLAAIPNL